MVALVHIYNCNYTNHNKLSLDENIDSVKHGLTISNHNKNN